MDHQWEITEEQGEVRGIEVVLAEWLFESIQNFHVLTLDKRYFEIPGGVERWLYLYARKATGGGAGIWKETFKSLYLKSASQQEYKHYANTLRKLVKKNELPGVRLEKVSSIQGKDMLLMERTDKRLPNEKAPAADKEVQMALIEKTPLEEAWENVLEILNKHLGEATVNAWIRILHLVSYEESTLTYRATTQFIVDTVETQYKPKLLQAWLAVGYDLKIIRFEVKSTKKGAA